MTCTRSAGFKARSHGKGLAEGRGDQVYRVRTAGASVGGGPGLLDSHGCDNINTYSQWHDCKLVNQYVLFYVLTGCVAGATNDYEDETIFMSHVFTCQVQEVEN